MDPSSTATATFSASTIETDENGNAEMEIINGPEGGDLKIIARLKRPGLYFIKDLRYTFSDDVDSDMEITAQINLFDRHGHRRLRNIKAGTQLTESFSQDSNSARVAFYVEKNGERVTGIELALTATSDKSPVTF